MIAIEYQQSLPRRHDENIASTDFWTVRPTLHHPSVPRSSCHREKRRL